MLEDHLQPLTFRNARGHGFKLVATAVGRLRSYAQLERRHHEAGGVLLGRYILDAHDVVVDQITEPTKRDLRSRFGFMRRKEGHQERTMQAWKASRGTCHYLGEWHTHPEPIPVASAVDCAGWKRLVARYQHDPDPLYFVIVGTTTIEVWQGHKQPITLEHLVLDIGMEE